MTLTYLTDAKSEFDIIVFPRFNYHTLTIILLKHLDQP